MPLPVGPGHQHHAVWQIERAFDPLPDVGRQAELGVVELDGGAVEDAQDDLLAVQRRDRRNPKVDLVTAHRQLDTAVLRQPPFGDVEPRHDLDARDDRGLQPRRRRLDLVQHAVIAIAYPQPVRKRLEMNVRGVRLDRPRDQLIDEPDDRRLTGEVLEPLRILFRRLGVGDHVVEHLLGVASLAELGIEPLEGGFELDRHGDRDRHRSAERRRDGISSKDVERIGHGERRPIITRRDRQRANPAQKFRL